MPLYHFDTVEDGELSRDDEGLEFTNLKVACDEAVRALGEMARDRLRCRDRQEIAISIRDGGLMPLLTASLVLRIEPKGLTAAAQAVVLASFRELKAVIFRTIAKR